MRSRFSLTMAGCAMAGAMLLSAAAAAADWRNPHIYRETSGSWTNAEYDDGTCHYKYSHNAYDNETHVNRWGDCSQLVIGPSGVPTPIYAAPYPGED